MRIIELDILRFGLNPPAKEFWRDSLPPINIQSRLFPVSIYLNAPLQKISRTHFKTSLPVAEAYDFLLAWHGEQ